MLDEVDSKSEKEEVKYEDTGVREAEAPEDFFEPIEKSEEKKEKTDESSLPKVEISDSSREVGALFEGLEDESHPFVKASDLKSSPKKETKAQDSPKNLEIPSQEDSSWDDKTALKNEESVISKADLIEIPEDSIVEVKPSEVEIEVEEGTSVDQIDSNVELNSNEISIDMDEEPHKTIDEEGVVEERRSSERVSQNVAVEMVFDGFTDFIQKCSVNISKGGMFIKSPQNYEVGTTIKLDVKLKDGYKLIKGEGEVVRIEDPKPEEPGIRGMGIKFLKLDDESTALINRIVDQREG